VIDGRRRPSNTFAIVRVVAGAVAGTILASGGEAPMHQLLYTIAECCRMAAIGRTKFYELIANGEIPVRKIGKKTLVAASDLRDWVERLPAIERKSRDRKPTQAEGWR
jgi:excisionase family DNA binding protein